jgi:hypothetical protein
VLPYRSTLTITLLIGIPACFAVASMIRRLAWWGTITSISSAGHAGLGQRFVAGPRHREHGRLEHFAPGHPDVSGCARPTTLLLIGSVDPAGRNVEQVRQGAVGAKHDRQDAPPVRRGRLDDRGAGAVAEEHRP